MLPTTGIISTSLVTIYAPKTTAYIKNMKFINPANTDWTLELYLVDSSTFKKTLLYKYELAAGKMINDSSEYVLTSTFTLQAKASVLNTTFVISGTEA